ncbi:hypothetical protein BDV26DRAFT_134542 [Aspergillus bertholletiae]|uniref:Uncharacterized protein n=1 Tax=Aspergillus bertholletiae TaxID=1226010 RepID=A0A5N7AN51_9EURO|nr:hypothetical protein BDV26DRAFT_134542 [Aspergillus bertholletiae]
MNATDRSPLFVVEEVLCSYPISTTYDSCPRYLFYALLLAVCITRWTGWLADVFLGAAATYAGTAAIQAFILVSSPAKYQPPQKVSIPWIPDNTSLWNDFPALITETNEIDIIPAAIELDADAVLSIVVTAYLVFLPLQCWSRIFAQERISSIIFSLWNALMFAGSISSLIYWPTLKKTPIQYAFCLPQLPPISPISSDGWESWELTSTWNSSVWTIFSNDSLLLQLNDVCFYPCFNTTQVLRQQTSLQATVASGDNRFTKRHKFWGKVIYSQRYIYSLVALSMVLNVLLMLIKVLPYHSRVPSSRVWEIWKERKNILRGLKEDFSAAAHGAPGRRGSMVEKTGTQLPLWKRASRYVTFRTMGLWAKVTFDVVIIFAVVFSIVVSPLTVIAFVVWIEYYIRHDGPSQETPQQVGQWSPLVSLALLMISAAIHKLKFWVAPRHEIEQNIEELKQEIERLETLRDRKSNTREFHSLRDRFSSEGRHDDCNQIE